MEMLNIANLDNVFAHSPSETRWSIWKVFILNILEINLRELRQGIPLEKLGGGDRYRIDYISVAETSRCAAKISNIALNIYLCWSGRRDSNPRPLLPRSATDRLPAPDRRLILHQPADTG
jgi:hypothetical protein